MNFVRFLTLLVLGLALAGGPVFAAPPTGGGMPQVLADRENHENQGNNQDEDRQSQARARGIITGAVVGVDYAHGVLRVISGRG
ncbi:MAG: hypothetical protein JOZ59_07640, partial [Candidatus Eremiobacteraeota bacterium]|nr:hypothetical protein [Candidatus Eremiobacteraeota bacterium]